MYIECSATRKQTPIEATTEKCRLLFFQWSFKTIASILLLQDLLNRRAFNLLPLLCPFSNTLFNRRYSVRISARCRSTF